MEGVCALTGEHGKFIASHLIPRALTRPSAPGRPLIQLGSGKQPIQRWDSWYDSGLVTIAGENILTDLDTWAIQELRAHKLIWSGWGNAQTLEGRFTKIGDSHMGIRRTSGLDTKRLRLFFLSLLWRAAATSRPEFSEVQVSGADLETLREMVATGNPNPSSFYRIHLTQLSTRGPAQNLVPIAQFKEIRSLIPGWKHRLEKIFRFYFDGLVAHIHLPETESIWVEDEGPLVLGAEQDIVLSTVTYQGSFQAENLAYVLSESLPSPLLHGIEAT